jgi:Ca2+-binding RTX toxin-like protein
MNAPFVVAQAVTSGQGITTGQAPSTPQVVKLTKPQGEQALVINLDAQTRLDFSAIASEKITLVRVGNRLVILFDNNATVTIEPFFGPDGKPMQSGGIDLDGNRIVTSEQFAALFPITEDQSILPAAGQGGPQNTGGQFRSPTVDALGDPGDPSPFGPGEDLGNSPFTFTINQFLDDTDAGPSGGSFTLVIDEEGPGLREGDFSFGGGNFGGDGDDVDPNDTSNDDERIGSGILPHNYSFGGPGSISFAPMNGVTQTINGVTYNFVWDAAINTLFAQVSGIDVFKIEITDPVSGAFTATLLHSLVHADLPADFEDNLLFNLTYLITNGLGQTATGTLVLNVDDDTPIVGSTPRQDIEEMPGMPASTTLSDIPLAISWGADDADGSLVFGDRSISFRETDPALLENNVSVSGSSPLSGKLTSNGNEVLYAIVHDATLGDVLVGYTGLSAPANLSHPSIVFTVSLSDMGSGSYTFELRQPLDHPAPDGDEHYLELTFDFTATDSDGDSDYTGSFTIRVDAAGVIRTINSLNDTIDYSSLTEGVFVNLANGKRIGPGAFPWLVQTVDGNTATDHDGSIDPTVGIDRLGDAIVNAIGGRGDDVIIGGSEANIIRGRGGNDTMRGAGGDDQMYGGRGDDFLRGDGGDDVLRGGRGDDVLLGNRGDDKLYGGRGEDELFGGRGNDYMDGGQGNDFMAGGRGADEMYGGAGDDHMHGDRGDDRMFGEGGDDLLEGGAGDDVIRGGAGWDWIYGDGGDDRLFGNTGDDNLFGGEGNDRLRGGAGDDNLHGGAGDDRFRGGAGDDNLYGNAGDDRMWGGEGDDTLRGGRGQDLMIGGDGRDTMYGGRGADEMYGGDGRDTMHGGRGSDLLVGGRGADEMHGGRGDDLLLGGRGDDTMHGGSGEDILFGGSGDDDLYGGSGWDVLAGGTGSDYLNGRADRDWLVYVAGWGQDTFVGGEAGDDYDTAVLIGSGGNDNLVVTLTGFEMFTADFGAPAGPEVDASEIERIWAFDIFGGGNDSLEILGDGSPNNITLTSDLFYEGANGETVVVAGGFENVRIEGRGNDDIIDASGFTERGVTLLGNGGDDEIIGSDQDDDIAGGAGDDDLRGRGGNDEIHGGAGSDTIVHTVGDGSDIVDGGFESPSGHDVLQVTNTRGATTFNIGTAVGGTNIVPNTGTDGTDIELSYGATTIRMDEIEDIELNLGSGGDTVNITTPLGGTSLHTSTITVEGGAGNDKVNASEIDSTLPVGVVFHGNGGDDTFHSGAGSDTFDGGESANDADTVIYGDGQIVSIVEAPGSDGDDFIITTTGGVIDTISNVEFIHNGSTVIDVTNSVWVFNGGSLSQTFDSIKDAVIYANALTPSGAGIVIEAGRNGGDDYNEGVVTVTQAMTIRGVGGDPVDVKGQFEVSGTLDGEFRLENFAIDAAGQEYGVFVDASSNPASAITLDGVSIENAIRNGFAYIAAGNNVSGNTPMPNASIVGAIAILNSVFTENGVGSSNGSGDILLYGFNGDFTLSDVTINGADSGIGAYRAIQMRGLQDGGDTPGTGPYDPAGDVSITGLTITGNYVNDLIAFYRIASFASFTTSGINLSASAPWGLFNFDSVGGEIDLSNGITATNLFAGGVIAKLQGLSSVDTLTGTNGNDVLIGRGGNDILNGGGGDDLLIDGGKTAFKGGAGNDTVDLSQLTGRVDVNLHLVNGAGGYAAHEATFTGIENLILNANDHTAAGGANIIVGNEAANYIFGAGRADNIRGLDGNDEIHGNDGDDVISGGAGADKLHGGLGNDTLQLESDPTPDMSVAHRVDLHEQKVSGGELDGDEISGFENAKAGHNTRAFFLGSSGDNVLTGSNYSDVLIGRDGNDTLIGSGDLAYHGPWNADVLVGGAGNDSLQGGGGNDIYVVDGTEALGDTFVEAATGGTNDRIVIGTINETTGDVEAPNGPLSLTDFRTGTTFGTANAANIEGLVLNGQTIAGTGNADTLDFSALDIRNTDSESVPTVATLTVNAGGGNDKVAGALNDINILYGEGGNDQLVGGNLGDRLVGGLGTDNLKGLGGNDTFELGRDVTAGGSRIMQLGADGETVSVSIAGLAGTADTVQGGSGHDKIELDAGGAPGYVLDYAKSPGMMSGVEEIVGTGGTDVILMAPGYTSDGVDGGVIIDGGAGNDSLAGGAGNDTIHGGADNDLIAGGAGNDTLNGDAGSDTIWGGVGDDGIDGGEGADLAAFSGAFDSYSITFDAADPAGPSITVVDNAPGANGDDGTDIVRDVESLQFANGVTVHIVDQSGAFGSFTTIQAAVDAADANDVILVRGGTYVEQVQVEGSGKDGLTIMAATGDIVTVTPPATLEKTADSPTSGRDLVSLISVEGADNVTIKGITVDGQQRGSDLSNAPDNGTLVGISYLNSDGGVIDGVTVAGIRESDSMFGVQRGVGIYVLNTDPDGGAATPGAGANLNAIEIKNSTVINFQKGGIVVANADVHIHDNTVTGIGATNWTAQNGIQVSGAIGSITGNTVNGIGYTGSGWSSTNILTFSNRDLVIGGNHIFGTGAGHLGVGVAAIDSTGVSVTNNEFHDLGWAIDVQDYAAGWPDALLPGGGTIFVGNTFFSIGDTFLYFNPNAATTAPFSVTGTSGYDAIYGAAGNDTLEGEDGDDFIDGRGGNDILRGGQGADEIHGGAGNDRIGGKQGNDTIFGDDGNDQLWGDGNNDTITGGAGNDEIYGGSGTDTVDYSVDGGSGGVFVNMSGTSVTRDFEGSATTQGATSATDTHGGTDTVITGIENVIGTGQSDVIVGSSAVNWLEGGAGDDHLEGAGGNDILVGEGGRDTAFYTQAITDNMIAMNGGGWTVTTGGAEGTDTLSDIEVVDGAGAGRFLLVGNGGFATIQDALTAAENGDTIMLAPGVYSGDIVISKEVSIVGAGPGVEIQGNFKSANGIADGGSVSDFLAETTTTSYADGGSKGLTIAADNVTIKNVKIDSFAAGIELGDGIDNVRIENVTIEDTVVGIRKGTEADVTNLHVVGGSISDSYHGIAFYKTTALGQAGNGIADHITIDGVTFSKLNEKGIYAEALSHALITGIIMNNVGELGRGPAFNSAVPANWGGFGNGIDLNLKNGAYEDITITGFTFTNVGSSDAGGSVHSFGGAIVIKARNDGSYAGAPATFGGEVIVSDGSIDGTSTGIRAGEPGQNNAGPAVTVTDVSIENALHSAEHGDVANVTQSVMTVNLTNDAEILIAAPNSTGSLVVHGGGGADQIVTALGADTLEGGADNDVLDGEAGQDTAFYTQAITDNMIAVNGGGGWTVTTGGAEGTDTLSDIEVVDGAGTGRFLLVGNGGFVTIQDALTAAANGDTIMLAPGTYDGNIVINKEVSIVGAGPGVVIEGNFETVNGITGSVADFLQTHAYSGGGTGLTINASNVTIKNVTLDSFNTGIELGAGIANIRIEGVDITDTVNGIHKAGDAAVTNLDIVGGTISDSYIGVYLEKYNGGADATDVTIDGTHFIHLTQKGIYAETLQGTTLFDNLVMNDVGQYGGGVAFGAQGKNGNGIDINLKYGTYIGAITIEGFDFDDVGLSNGLGSSHANAAAISIKTRDDAPSYGSNSASFVGLVLIQDGSIDGTSTGIRAGEAGKTIGGPAVTVSDVTITGSVSDGVHGMVDNVTQSLFTITLSDASETFIPAPTSTGSFNVSGEGGNDVIHGGVNNDTLAGGDGDDVFYATGGDTIVEGNGALSGIDEVRTADSFMLPDNVENLTLLDGGSQTDNFENFDLGPITNGENGWKVVGGARDQNVVTDPDDPTNQVFRMSSDPSIPDFAGPYSASLPFTAGEPSTSADYSGQSVKFRFKAADPAGDNSRLEVDFGNAAGTDRNNFMVIESTAGGIRIAVNEPKLDGNWTTNDFTAFTGNIMLASGKSLADWHEIELRLTYVDGANNDVIAVYLDGQYIGQTTTFENYRDALGGSHETNAEANQTSRVFFRPTSGGAATDGSGGVNEGFYFDDLTTSVYNNANATGNALDNVIVGNAGDNVITGLGGDDTLSGGAGNDTFLYTVGDGRDVVDGGTEASADILDVTGTGAGENFFIETKADYNARVNPDYAGSAEILVSSGNDILVEATEIEDIVIHGGGGADTLAVSGSFTGTSLLTSTIHFDGGEGDDTIDVSGRSSAHRVVAQGGNGNDKAILGFDYDEADYAEIFDTDGTTLIGVKITHTVGGEIVTDEFRGVENFEFTDGTRNLPGLFNETPVAQDDVILAVEDITSTGNLFANNGSGEDSDADGDTLRLVSIDIDGAGGAAPIPVNVTGDDWQTIDLGDGILQVQADGDYRFTTDANSSVQERFSYTVTDGRGGFDSADVTVRVAPDADAPVLTINPIINVSDPADNNAEDTDPAVTALANGGFVVTWSANRDGDADIYARVYDAAGTPGAEFNISDPSDNNATDFESSVTALANGGFVVTWSASRDGDYDIYARVYDATGTPGAEFNISDPSDNNVYDYEPTVTALANGGFVVTWYANRDGDADIYARVYDAAGAPGAEFNISDPSDNNFNDNMSSVTALANGGFVVTWAANRDGDYDIYARVYDATGTPGAEFNISDPNDNNFSDNLSSVTALANGDFVVTWTASRDGDADIYARVYNAAGAPGAEFNISDPSDNNGNDYEPSVTALANGGFVVTWYASRDGDYDIYARVYDSYEDQPGGISLPQIAAALTDLDGSERLTLTISGIPDGAALTDGVRTFTAGAGSNSVAVTGWSLSALKILPPLDYSGNLALTVTATVTDHAVDAAVAQTVGLGGLAGTSIANATDITNFLYQTSTDPEIDDAARRPSVTVNALKGPGDTHFYRIDIAQDGTLVAFDIDSNEGFNFDSSVRLLDSSGLSIVAENDDRISVDPGSNNGAHSYLEATLNAGTYYLNVGQITNGSFGGFGNSGLAYDLQVSIVPPGFTSVTDTQTWTQTIDVVVNPVNDAPVLDLDGDNSSGPGGGAYLTTATINGGGVTIADSDMVLSDVDDTHLEGLTVAIVSPKLGDVLALNIPRPAGINFDSVNSNLGNLIFTGHATLADYQTLIRNITFHTTSGDTTQRSIAVTVSDGDSGTGVGTIVNINHAPVITSAPGGGVNEDGNVGYIGGNIFANPGFEHDPNPYIEADNFTSWTYSTNSPAVGLWDRNVGGSQYVHSGRYSVWLTKGNPTDGYIAQDFQTVAGLTYEVSYWLYRQSTANFVASINGVAEQSFGWGEGLGGYSRYSFQFTGTGNLTWLRFAVDTDTGGYGAIIDDISLVAIGPAAQQTANGTIAFTDADDTDAHAASFVAQGADYLGAFSLGGVNQAGNSVGWSFVADNAALQVLRGGEVRTQTYAVTVTDGRGGSDTENVTVTLTGVNDAPVLDAIAPANFTDTAGDDPFDPVIGTLTHTDVDVNDTATYAIVGGTSSTLPGYHFAKVGTYGTLHVNSATGAYTYVPNDGAMEALNADASESFTLTVTDGSGATSMQTFTVNLTGAPEVEPFTVSVTPNDLSIIEFATGDFTVNSFTPGQQQRPGTAALAGGGFVVTWASNDQDGSSHGVYAQRYAADGTAAGGEVRVNTYTANAQTFPAVAGLTDGGYVITWQSSFNNAGADPFDGVYAQRYAADGTAIGGETLVTTDVNGNARLPAVAALSAGGYVITWISEHVDGSWDVFSQRFAADGTRQGGETRVNSFTNHNQEFSAVAGLTDGGFVVTWSSNGQDGSGYGIYSQRYDASGVAQEIETRVNTETGLAQNYSAVAGLADGGYVVTWSSANNLQEGNNDPAGFAWGIYAQRYAADGSPVGGETLVNSTTASTQIHSSITAMPDGGYLITWKSLFQDGDTSYNIYGQRFLADGTAVGGEFRVNQDAAGDQSLYGDSGGAGVAATADGKVIAVWVQDDADVEARIFEFGSVVSMAEDTDAAVPVAVTLTDIDGSEQVARVELSGLPAGTFFNVGAADPSDPARWIISNPTAAQLAGLMLTPPLDYNDTFTLTVTATVRETDTLPGGAVPQERSESTQVNIIVTPVNDPVSIASNNGDPFALTVDEGTTSALTTIVASDVDGPAAHVWSLSGADANRFNISSSGVLTFKTAPDFELPADAGGDNVYDVIVQVFDGTFSDTQAIAVTVADIDEAPVAVNDSARAVPGVTLLVNAAQGVLANDQAPDAGDAHSVIAGAFATAQGGSITFNEDGSYGYTAATGFTGVDTVNYTVHDQANNTDTGTLTINVTSNPTIAGGSFAGSVTEDATVTSGNMIVNGTFDSHSENGNNVTGWGEIPGNPNAAIGVPTWVGGSANYLEISGGIYSPYLVAYQSFATTPGAHYAVSFDLGRLFGGGQPFVLQAIFGDTVLVTRTSPGNGSNTHYVFDVVATDPTTTLQFVATYTGADGFAERWILDNVVVTTPVVLAQQTADGVISFSDAEVGETHQATSLPKGGGAGYIGTFTLDPVNQAGDSVGWHFVANNADLQFLAPGETRDQVYLVTITDQYGGSVTREVTVTLRGADAIFNDAANDVVMDQWLSNPAADWGASPLNAGGGNDTVYLPTDTSSPAYDSLFRNKTFNAGDGNDRIYVRNGDIDLQGWNGTDTLDFSLIANPGGVRVSLGNPGWGEVDIGRDNSGRYVTHDFINQNFNNIIGSDFNDVLNGELNANVIDGGTGDDVLNGNGGNDTLHGGAGNDILNGGEQDSDTLVGGSGNDTLNGGFENAGNGIDTVDYSQETGTQGVTVNLSNTASPNSIPAHTAFDTFGHIDTLSDIEEVIGTAQMDSMYGSEDADIFRGRGNDDALVGNGGNDKLYGDGGNDTLWGDAGLDQLFGGLGDDLLVGGAGVDTLWGEAGNDDFVFLNWQENGGTGPDIIKDFAAGDEIILDQSGFGNLGFTGSPDSTQFDKGPSTVNQTEPLFFDTMNNTLYYQYTAGSWTALAHLENGTLDGSQIRVVP